MNLAERALEEAAITAIHKAVGDTLNNTRGAMQTMLEETGIERLAAKLPDGTKVASLTVSNPTPKPVVVDEEQFIRFVEDIAPTEVVKVTVKSVRPAYLKTLMEAMEKRGVAEILDPENGELLEVDGVEMKSRASSHSVTFEGGEDGRRLLEAAMRAGVLDHIAGLPQLPAGSDQ